MAGFRCVYINMGPLKIAREVGGFKFRYNGGGIDSFGGNAYCVPVRPGHLRRRYLWIIAGGPLAAILQIGVLLGLWLLWRDRPAAVEMIAWLMLTPLIKLPANVFPWPGWDNDAQHFLRYWEKPELTGREEAITMLHAATIAGQRPRDYPAEWLAEALTPADGSSAEMTGHFYHYTYCLDKGEPERAVLFLETCLDMLAAAPPEKRWAGCLLEAAYFEAWYGRDGQTARAWLKLARQYPDDWNRLETRQVHLRVEAAVLLAEGKSVQSTVTAQESLKLLEQFTNIGDALAERAMLEEIVAAGVLGQSGEQTPVAATGTTLAETSWAFWE
jgi:hypothetical protein